MNHMNKVSQAGDGTEGESLSDYYKSHPLAHEQHHAMHVLTLLYFLIRRTMKGERVARRIVGRIIHHLMDLREFLEEGELAGLVNALYSGLQVEYDLSLGLFRRRIHQGGKAFVKRMGLRDGTPAFSKIASALIAASEEERQQVISMYPWLVTNQDKIMRFAKYYGKEHILRSLFP